MSLSRHSDPDSIWNVGPFADGKRVVVIFPISVGDPDAALERACRKAYGSSFERILPHHSPEAYESAYRVINQHLQAGEVMTVLEPQFGRVTFFTPKRENKAWSAYVRIVDVTRFFLN